MNPDDILDQIEELIDTISPNQRQRLANIIKIPTPQISPPVVAPTSTPAVAQRAIPANASQSASSTRDTGAATFGSMVQQLAPVSAPSIPQAGERVVRHRAKSTANNAIKSAVKGVTGEPKGLSMMSTADKIIKGPDTSGINDLGTAMGAMARSSSKPEIDPKKSALFQPKSVTEFYSKFLQMTI